MLEKKVTELMAEGMHQGDVYGAIRDDYEFIHVEKKDIWREIFNQQKKEPLK